LLLPLAQPSIGVGVEINHGTSIAVVGDVFDAVQLMLAVLDRVVFAALGPKAFADF